MSTYLIGFEIKQGEFPNEKTGEIVPYNNRILKCVTDDGQNGTNFGFSGFEVKLKMSDVAFSLGVPERDESVDTALKNINKKEIEIKSAPKNGTLAVVGFRPVIKK